MSIKKRFGVASAYAIGLGVENLIILKIANNEQWLAITLVWTIACFISKFLVLQYKEWKNGISDEEVDSSQFAWVSTFFALCCVIFVCNAVNLYDLWPFSIYFLIPFVAIALSESIIKRINS